MTGSQIRNLLITSPTPQPLHQGPTPTVFVTQLKLKFELNRATCAGFWTNSEKENGIKSTKERFARPFCLVDSAVRTEDGQLSSTKWMDILAVRWNSVVGGQIARYHVANRRQPAAYIVVIKTSSHLSACISLTTLEGVSLPDGSRIPIRCLLRTVDDESL